MPNACSDNFGTSFREHKCKYSEERDCCTGSLGWALASKSAYHLEWWILNEDRFGELSIVLLRDVDAFSGQSLQDPVMVLIVIVGIRIYVGQSEAVEFRIWKRVDDLRLQMFLFLCANSDINFRTLKAVRSSYIISILSQLLRHYSRVNNYTSWGIYKLFCLNLRDILNRKRLSVTEIKYFQRKENCYLMWILSWF